jgi:surface protein
MYGMFSGCSKLSQLDLTNFDTRKVQTMTNMFNGCRNLNPLDVTGFTTSNVENLNGMFEGCGSLTSLDLSNFNISTTIGDIHMSYMFSGCDNLQTITFSANFRTESVTSMADMFKGCSSLDVNTFNTIFNFTTSNVVTMSYMFADCTQLIDIYVNDTTSVTNMEGMFSGCTGLTSIIFPSDLNTTNVENMSYMFKDCSSLDANTFNTIFNFNTSNVEYMQYMFAGCNQLNTVTFGSDFTTSKVENMRGMFFGCRSLISLDLSGFDTSKVTDMNQMFINVPVTTLDLSSWDFTSVENYSGIFENVENLNTVYVSDSFRPPGKEEQADDFSLTGGLYENFFNIIVPDSATYNYLLQTFEINGTTWTGRVLNYITVRIADAEAGADPYIKPIYGQLYKLPDIDACYRLIQTPNIIVNAQVQSVDQQFINTRLKDLTDVRFNSVENHVYDWESMHFFTKLCIIYNDEVCIYNMLSGTCEGNVPEWLSLNETTNSTSSLNMYKGEPAVQTYILEVSDILKLEVAIYDNPQILSGVKIIEVPEKTTGLLIRRYSSNSSLVKDLYDNTSCNFLQANDNNKVTEIFYTNNGMKNTREIIVV